MPVSAYVQSAIFLVLAALALFASAGTLAILGFWLYLAILAAIIVASLLALDPGLLRERMRPGGQRPPLALRLFTTVMFLHWIVAGLDRGRFHWSDGASSLPFLLYRAISEDRVLQTELPAADYARRVRWRLVPGIW
jgi:hypothetical protein